MNSILLTLLITANFPTPRHYKLDFRVNVCSSKTADVFMKRYMRCRSTIMLAANK